MGAGIKLAGVVAGGTVAAPQGAVCVGSHCCMFATDGIHVVGDTEPESDGEPGFNLDGEPSSILVG
jgi:hypothetical protein